jgi:hypothetical protein
MKTYQIELKRISYINLTIEADNEDEAERLAWEEVSDGYYGNGDAHWDIESIEEEIATDETRSYGPQGEKA